MGAIFAGTLNKQISIHEFAYNTIPIKPFAATK